MVKPVLGPLFLMGLIRHQLTFYHGLELELGNKGTGPRYSPASLENSLVVKGYRSTLVNTDVSNHPQMTAPSGAMPAGPPVGHFVKVRHLKSKLDARGRND